MDIDECPSDNDDRCKLCQYYGNGDVISKKIKAYLVSSLINVEREEVCRQVSDEMNAQQLPMTAVEVRTHIESHMQHKDVILSNVVHDLQNIVKIGARNSIYECPETNLKTIDVKSISIYLKAVDSLDKVLKNDTFKLDNK